LTQTQLLALVGAAVLVFWMVGAYNRLVALRNVLAGAWAQVDEALRQRGDAIARLEVALREPLAAERSALDALLAAQVQLRAAADALGARPVAATLAAALLTSESALAASGSRVLSLLDQQRELRQEGPLAAHLAAWSEADARLPFARQLFNQAAAHYDDAVRQFPTGLLARVYGFSAAGRL
jgi:LemA protein